MSRDDAYLETIDVPSNTTECSLEQTIDGSVSAEALTEDARLSQQSSLGLRALNFGLMGGERIGHFEVLRELGRGGMGTVYEAFNHTLKRRVALKLLHVKEGASLEALMREAQSIAQLEHPNIVQVYHLGELSYDQERALYIEMQLVQGRPLTALMAHDELSQAQRFNLLLQVLEGLKHAHERGVIHRDIKPDNILVTHGGEVKLVDFGISSIRSQGDERGRDASRAGTPAYMAPEVWERGEWSVESDLYALGVSAYSLLCGALPFCFPLEGGWQGFMDTHLSEEPAPYPAELKLPKGLAQLLSASLSKKPEERPSSAQVLIDEIERHLEDLDPRALSHDESAPKSPLHALQRWLSQRRDLVISLTALGSLAMIFSLSKPLQRLDNDALDLLQTVQPLPKQQPLGLIELDELTYLDREQHLNREALTQRVETLFKLGAQSVGVDLIQDDPSPSQLALRDLYWQELAKDNHRLTIAVASLDSEINQHRSPLQSDESSLKPQHAIQLRFDYLSAHPEELSLQGGRERYEMKEGFNAAQARDFYYELTEPDDPHEPFNDSSEKRVRARYERLRSASSLLLPYPGLLESTSALGHINLSVDEDGVVRKVPLLMRYQDRVFPSLGLLVAMRSLRAGLKDLNYLRQTIIITPPDHEPIYIPVDEEGAMTLRVRGNPSQRERHSLLSLVEGTAQADQYRAQAYIIGATAATAGDKGRIAQWRHVPMSYAHLLVAENILNQDFIYPIRTRDLFILSALLSLMTFLITLWSKEGWGLLSVALSSALTLGCGVVALSMLDRELPLVSLLSLVLISGFAAMSINGLRARRAQRSLTERLDEALPPRVAQALISGRAPPSRLIKPQRRVITLVCVRLSPLDELSDELPPKALSELLVAFSDILRATALERGAIVIPSQRSSAHVAFLRSAPRDGALEALRFASQLRSRWQSELWRWRRLEVTPSLSLSIGQGRCAWGPLGLNSGSELCAQGSFVDRVERAASLSEGQSLVMSEVLAELSPDGQGSTLSLNLAGAGYGENSGLVLSPGPALSLSESEADEPLTCYFVTATHQAPQ